MIIYEGRRGGTRGSGYAYVLIGNELVHVSEVGRLIKRDSDVYIYEVPDNVAGYVYFFEYSNQGYSYVSRCPPGNYKKPDDFKRCDFELLEKVVSTWLPGVRFRVKSRELEQLLNELFSEFTVMANEVKSYWASLGGELRFMGHSARLREFFSNPRVYYFSELSIPRDDGRVRGIKTVMSLVYENWVAVKVAEALGSKDLIRRSWEESQPLINQPVTVWFEQGGTTSYAILDTSGGPVTMWVEFQESPEIHVFPGTEVVKRRGRRAVRPDIVIVKGRYSIVDELVKSGNGIDLLIECKVLPYNEWEENVEEQVIPYKEYFKPRSMLLVSRHEVPRNVKEVLSKRGINVMDNVRLGNKAVEELKKQVQEVLR